MFRLLIVRSTPPSDDITTRARIRDAALARFPTQGFEATTVREIAKDAGVSPALVLHHFGSKEGLLRACDEVVVRRFRETKEAAMEAGNIFNPSFAGSALEVAEPISRYLAWALARGNESTNDLFDEMVREAMVITRLAIERGYVRDSSDLEMRVALQMSMQLGSLVLHHHLERVLGVDVLSSEGLATIAPVVLEIVSGVFEPEVASKLQEMYASSKDGPSRRASGQSS